jgi:hypothetical protein
VPELALVTIVDDVLKPNADLTSDMDSASRNARSL